MGTLAWLRWLGVGAVAVAIFLSPSRGLEAGQANPKLAEIIKKAAQEGEITYQGPTRRRVCLRVKCSGTWSDWSKSTSASSCG